MKKVYLSLRGWFGRSIPCSLLMMTLAVSAGAQNGLALQKRVTVSVRNQPISNVLSEIERQTNLNFVYDGAIVREHGPVTISARNIAVQDVLQDVFKNDYTYTVIGDKVIVKNAPEQVQQEQQDKSYAFSGKVLLRDNKGDARQAPGITVQIKGTSKGTQTDADGKFTLTVKKEDILIVRYVGYKQEEFPVNGRKSATITIDEDVSKIKEVVITGIYERNKESFSGSVATYTSRELKQVGNQNIIQSLRSLDPAFTVFENNLKGSNPNTLPNLEIRGKSSVIGLKETFGTDPNQPLFILDGFETDLRTIVDLDMNRVESVTILKDASSTAIYGAKAANGVVVIETRKPKQGELRISYTTDNSITVPDLRDYNLMNASEKLQFEKAVGMYTQPTGNPDQRQQYLDSLYSTHLANIAKGINTYWLSEPLRTGFTTGHSLYVDGGDQAMRYSAGINYKKTSGVMKGSGRDQGGGNLKLMYRKNKLAFSNNFSASFYTANESPYGSFSNFAYASPYYPKYNAEGGVNPYLEIYDAANGQRRVANPLYNAMLDSRDQSKNFQVINNFVTEYSINNDWRLRGRIGITRDQTENEVFTSPQHTQFALKSIKERGYYKKLMDHAFTYDGELTATFGKVIALKHQLNAVGGWNFRSRKQTQEGYESSGFPEGVSSPAFAAAYLLNGKPINYEAIKHNTSFYFNGGYVYDRRFVLEANYRKDGSSVYGLNRYFTDSWSVGASWNLHNERFMRQYPMISMLKLRGSVGTPGNQNFSSYQTYTLYQYSAGLQNNFGSGVDISAFGNPDLQWQKTLDKNLGLDVVLFDNRIRFTGDVYNRVTDPLLAYFNIPASTGTTSTTTNLGKQVANGYNFQLSGSPIYRPAERIIWTLSVSAKHESAHYEDLSARLESMNKENQGLNTTRYFDGGSPTAIWGVRSAGIDPGTGNEIFIKKDGTHTFTYDYKDEVILGDERPDLDGIIGSTVNFKGITLGIYLRYRVGGDVFNDAVYSKVDNINVNTIDRNADRRALYDRWLKPGDVARYKVIRMSTDKNVLIANSSKMTSRFVQTENTLAGESISMGYDFPAAMVKKWGMTSLRLNAYTNDIFRFSSIKRERGLDYPFANTVAFSINVGF